MKTTGWIGVRLRSPDTNPAAVHDALKKIKGATVLAALHDGDVLAIKVSPKVSKRALMLISGNRSVTKAMAL